MQVAYRNESFKPEEVGKNYSMDIGPSNGPSNQLHSACFKGRLDIVKQQLAKNPRLVCKKDEHDMTPLHIATICDNADIVNELIKHRSVSLAVNNREETPLHMAAAEGRLKIVEYLMRKAGSDGELETLLSSKDRNGSTPLHVAIYSNHEEIIFRLIEKSIPYGRKILNAEQNNKMTPLHLAACTGNINVVKKLVSHKVDIDPKWENGATPLVTAAKYGHARIVVYLLECNADWKKKTKKGYTALLTAAKYGRADVVQCMVHRVNARVTDDKGRNIFHICAARDEKEVLKKIINEDEFISKIINVPDNDLNTPLHIAAREGNLDVLEFLLEKNASKSLKDKTQKTPLHLAVISGHVKVVKSLLDSNIRLVHDYDEHGNTALHLAALEQRANCVQQLLKAGANFRVRNNGGQTPLDCCAFKGQIKGAEILLESGAPLSLENNEKDRKTPLQWACKGGHVELVKLFMRKGALAIDKDSKGRNALDIAADNRKGDCALEIIKGRDWKKALKNVTLRSCDDNSKKPRVVDDTPMRKLIRNLPEVAEEVFEKCSRFEPDSKEKQKEKQHLFNFEFVDDFYHRGNWNKLEDEDNGTNIPILPLREEKKNHCLEIIIDSKNTELLRHPLIRRLVTYKWEDANLRFLFWTIFLFYAVFMLTFNIYMATTPPPFSINTTSTSYNGSCVQVIEEAQEVWGAECSLKHSEWQRYVGYVSIAFATLNLLKEIVQLLRDVKNYFKEVTNWIEMTLFISSIATMVPWTEYTRNTGVLMVWQWQLGSVAIFLSWMELLFFVESIPKFGLGIYVLMFANIVKTFLKFLIVLSVFVFAFAFTFHALFQNQVAFMYLWNSIVKTIVIMIGEIEYDSMFNSEHTSSEYSVQVHYNEISYFVFVVALMTMSIIVMNMLVGLAVDDIKQVQNKAELKSISQHAKLVLETEYLLPRWLNNWKMMLSKTTLKQSDTDKREIKKYHSRKKDDGKRIEEKVQNVKADVQALRMRLHDINKRTQSIESMVKINMKYNEFDYDGDDDDLDV